MAAHYFGTDGIRGKANCSPLTPELMITLARAVVTTLEIPTGSVVLIGLDTRVSGLMLEAALTSAFLSEGLNVGHLGVVSTPITACLTRESNAAAGIMITASHNPFQDNGIKVFTAEGFKLTTEQEKKIEALLPAPATSTPAEEKEVGISLNMEAPERLYFDKLSALASEVSFDGLKVVVDCANGSNSFKAVPFLESLGLEVVPMAVEPDGRNINENCGAVHPESAARLVSSERADLGICFDGDGDRLIMIDEKGKVVSGDRLLYSAAVAMHVRDELAQHTMVATVMSNLGLRDALQKKGISLITTGVGDRLVFEEMQKGAYNLGGENSGHLIFGDHTTTGDGLLSALLILLEMKRSGKSLSALSAEMTEYPSLLVNLEVDTKPPLESIPRLSETLAHIEDELGTKGRVFLRYSGTENKLRVLVEASQEEQVEKYSSLLCEVIRSAS